STRVARSAPPGALCRPGSSSGATRTRRGARTSAAWPSSGARGSSGTGAPPTSPTRARSAFLSFPSGSYLYIEPELYTPLFTQGDFSLRIDTEVQLRWTLPNDTFTLGRSVLGGDRLGIYETARLSLDRFGLDGKACILRSICEAAEYPLENEGLLGEVLNIVLTASRTTTEDGAEQEYTQAEYQGRSQGDCYAAYPDCPVSMFNLI
ncbi:uncharacterized protein LOC119103860, partial [Pollicipes pollicipes]|uniref:uncharacterized protein LOC119103860 n=1 Tax=Pollicipes pollicipes TaxID=41117 RepID=UPI0018851AF8